MYMEVFENKHLHVHYYRPGSAGWETPRFLYWSWRPSLSMPIANPTLSLFEEFYAQVVNP